MNNLIEIWECQWDQLVKENPQITEFIKNEKDIRPDLKPRDALFGGRTNAALLYYKAKWNEKIKYVDFTSVYPSVMKTCKFPVGFPQVISENFDSIDNYFGLIHCQLLPPQNILFPVLPTRYDNKLLFVLCRSCAENKIEICTHNQSERIIEGTWISEEIKEAINQGYVLIRIFQIWHYELIEQYDIPTKTGGLFTGYINKFLKMKTEATGFPTNVINDDDKQQFIDKYFEQEGVHLDINNMKPNPGMKAISKLFLNSLWGRFGLNSNKTQHKLITEVSELYKLFLDAQFVVKDVNFLNDNICQAFFTKHEEMHEGSVDTNVVIAAFVTCYARLKLLKLLTKLEKRVLYFDTDSVIYISTDGEWEPPLGDFLGELTNELDSDDFIVEGVFPGPKNYGYITHKGKSMCKVKGFSLNYKAGEKVNFKSMKNMILNELGQNSKIVAEQSVINRNKKNWTICSSIVPKIYSHVYDKRIINPDLTTRPYGFI